MARVSRRSSVRTLQKEERVLRMYVAGATYQLIADTVEGISSASNACTIVTRALARHAEERNDLAAHASERAFARLEAIWAGSFPQAARGDAQAANVCLRVHDRMVKLEGLDSPEKLEITMRTQFDEGIEKMLADMDAMTPNQPPAFHDDLAALDGPR